MGALLRKSIAIGLILCFVTLIQADYVQGQSLPILTGIVRDGNGKPLPGASIFVLRRWRGVVGNSTTDSKGRFSLTLDREGTYSVYALLDRPDTPGVDYVPSLWDTHAQIGTTTSFTFALKKGASLYFDGNVRIVETGKAADSCTFKVMRADAPLSGDLVTTYGLGGIYDRLGWSSDLDERLVVIPADTEVIVNVFAQSTFAYDNFTIKGESGYFKLPQGEMLRVDVTEDSLDSNLEKLRQMLNSASSLLQNADDAGFLVTVERQDLQEAHDQLDSSLASMKKGFYDESFARMRNVYILTRKTTDYLRGLFQISSETVLLLPFLFMFVASALASLVTERKSSIEPPIQERKITLPINSSVTVICYAVLFASFYLLYPGSRITSQTSLVISTVLALILWQVVAVVLPRISSEKKSEPHSIQFGSAIIIAFSMAFRNLRRRELRTILSLANMMILIFGFITLTSISPGYGLIKQNLRPVVPVDALLIRSVPLGATLSHLPLPSSFITWLESQQNVTIISPKAENIPLDRPVGYLRTQAGDEIPFQGVIGIKPCVESRFTLFHEIITDGNYLQCGDDCGILISSTRHGILEVGDSISSFGREFVIRGFFDPEALESLVDVDGLVLIPRRLDPIAGPVHVAGDRVIIVNYDTAMTLPNIVISRVNVQLQNPSPEGYSDFAEMVTLIMEYRVYISHPDSLQLQLLGASIEEKGAGIMPFLMVLVILNISASMLTTVQERRKEIAALTSVGLNPTHIASLFMAEATVTGFIGGGLGYLLGVMGYRLVPSTLLGALQVREKVSAEWGLIALILSNSTAILASVMPSIQASMITIPSLLRKWRLHEEEETNKANQPWTIDLPTKLMPRDLESFTTFTLERLRQAHFVTEITLKEEATGKGPSKTITFKHLDIATSYQSANEMTIQPAMGDRSSVKLRCIPPMNRKDIVHKTATDIRKIILEWNVSGLRSSSSPERNQQTQRRP